MTIELIIEKIFYNKNTKLTMEEQTTFTTNSLINFKGKESLLAIGYDHSKTKKDPTCIQVFGLPIDGIKAGDTHFF